MAHRLRRWLPAAPVWAAMLLAACTPGGRDTPSAFVANGEVIAFGGGEAGATNACFTCHGRAGEGDGDSVPRLAGLPAGYLDKQLLDYADGRRRHEAMHAIARALSPESRRLVSEWYARLPSPPRIVAAAAPDLGGALYHRGRPEGGLPPCADCHGGLGEGGGLANPPLAGQPAAYIADQLRRWRSGERQNGPRGQMLGVSQALSDQETAAVSLYAASLPGHASRAASGKGSSPPARRPDQ